MGWQSKYLTNVGTIKAFNNSYFKLTNSFVLRNSGFEIEQKFVAKGRGGHDEKLRNSISRTKATVFELVICNDWEYFVTLTLDQEKKDRYDLKESVKKLGYFIQNYNRNHKLSIDYMLIPEQHLDGAWHMHGFFMGLPIEHLQQFNLEMTLPTKIRTRLENGKTIYSWGAYQKSFGWCYIEKIENPEAIAKYITKYITKDLSRSVTSLNAKMYYCTKNLNRSVVIHRDFLEKAIENPDYENEYVSVKIFENLEDAFSYFIGGDHHGENDIISSRSGTSNGS